MCFSLEQKMDFYLVYSQKERDKTAAWIPPQLPILYNNIRT